MMCKKNVTTPILIVCLLFLIYTMSCNAVGQEVPTPLEFITLQKSLAEKFSTVKAKIKSEVYKSYNGVYEDKTDAEYTNLAKWKPNYGFFEVTTDRMPDISKGYGAPPNRVEIESNCPDQCRSLEKIGGTLRGIIQRESFPRANLIDDPYNMTLGNMPINYHNIHIDKATTHILGENQIVLEGSDDRYNYLVIIDKRYSYMPVLIESKTKKGKIFQQCIFEDYRKVTDDLWLPFSYTHCVTLGKKNEHQTLDGQRKKETVLEISVNQSLSDDEFMLPFPVGTYVNDKISKIDYVMGEKENNIKGAIFDELSMGTISSEKLSKQLLPEKELVKASDKLLRLSQQKKERDVRINQLFFWILGGVFLLGSVVLIYIIYKRRKTTYA